MSAPKELTLRASDVVALYDAIHAFQTEMLEAQERLFQAERQPHTPPAVVEAYRILASQAEQDAVDAQERFDREASEFLSLVEQQQ